MWNRKELKGNAKALLKANYWKTVAATLVLGICGGATAAVSSQTASDEGAGEMLVQQLEDMGPEAIIGALFVVLSAIAVVYFVSFLLSVFVYHPFEIGAQKLLVNCKENKAEYGNLVFSFRNSYFNAVKTMFLRWLFRKLWGLLFVIPGIIKSYEYRMIPYLLAENPQMSSKEAFARSKEMMQGNKWDAFVLDLSFLGWHLLSICTCGIVGVFYSGPYCNLTGAELYHKLKK